MSTKHLKKLRISSLYLVSIGVKWIQYLLAINLSVLIPQTNWEKYRNWENCSSDSLNQYFAFMEYLARKICIIQSTRYLSCLYIFPWYFTSLCLTEYRYSVSSIDINLSYTMYHGTWNCVQHRLMVSFPKCITCICFIHNKHNT